MRKKAERQLPIEFAFPQKKKQMREYLRFYKAMSDLLDQNPAILDAVHKDLEAGEKKLNRNVEGVSSETVLRLIVVQQVEDLSFRDLIVRVGDSWMLCFFVRVYDDPLIDYSTFNKLANCITPETWKTINEILVRFAKDKKGAKGEHLRIDTTVVETDVHYPTDSSLLFDCVRVLSRKIAEVRRIDTRVVGDQRARVKHAKKLAYRITMEARGKQHKTRMKSLHGKLIAAAERTRTWALSVQERMKECAPQDRAARLRWTQLRSDLRHYSELAGRCIHQCRERTQHERAVCNDQKVMSIFEPHTELLKRGKAGKDVEFGHMLELHQIEGGLITHYEVHAKRPYEPGCVGPAIKNHVEIFGRAPKLMGTDKGFHAPGIADAAREAGVKMPAIPKKGMRTPAEEKHEHSVLFRLAQAFRAGIEGTISVLKRAYGLWRCLREGWAHYQSYIGAGIFAHNLARLARC
jgi:transposase, IS5 family